MKKFNAKLLLVIVFVTMLKISFSQTFKIIDVNSNKTISENSIIKCKLPNGTIGTFKNETGLDFIKIDSIFPYGADKGKKLTLNISCKGYKSKKIEWIIQAKKKPKDIFLKKISSKTPSVTKKNKKKIEKNKDEQINQNSENTKENSENIEENSKNINYQSQISEDNRSRISSFEEEKEKEKKEEKEKFEKEEKEKFEKENSYIKTIQNNGNVFFKLTKIILKNDKNKKIFFDKNFEETVKIYFSSRGDKKKKENIFNNSDSDFKDFFIQNLKNGNFLLKILVKGKEKYLKTNDNNKNEFIILDYDASKDEIYFEQNFIIDKTDSMDSYTTEKVPLKFEIYLKYKNKEILIYKEDYE